MDQAAGQTGGVENPGPNRARDEHGESTSSLAATALTFWDLVDRARQQGRGAMLRLALLLVLVAVDALLLVDLLLAVGYRVLR